MSAILTPISDLEYSSLLGELYESLPEGQKKLRFTVDLPEDPSVNPLELSLKLSRVQSLKDRLIVIMNRGLTNKSYWDTAVLRIQSALETEVASQMINNSEVKGAKNAESRKSAAELFAKKELHPKIFSKYPTFDDGMAFVLTKQSEANAFYNEVKNIYSNLDDKSMALAVQLKTIILNARLNGLVSLEDNNEIA